MEAWEQNRRECRLARLASGVRESCQTQQAAALGPLPAERVAQASVSLQPLGTGVEYRP
jgi:hypothetical protein